MRVAVLGAGYVGATSAAVLAAIGHQVSCVERDPARLAVWTSGRDPLAEPGLAALLTRVERNLQFTGSADDLAAADVVVIAVGTPTGNHGMPDLAQVQDAAADIAAHARAGTVVLVRSTVPVGTCDRLQTDGLRDMVVVSNPEFLREGHALEDAFAPDRIVAGGPDRARPTVETLYEPIITRALDERSFRLAPVPLLWMSARSAEMAKYAANGFLATKLSFVNEIANLAGAVGADADAVLGSMGYDPRIGPQHLRPGLGWGGSCFPKDTRALQAIADGVGYDFVVLRAAIDQNTRQLGGFAASIRRSILPGGTVGLLGLAFKAGTPDTRESPAIALARALVRSGLEVRAFDPAVRALPDDAGVDVRQSVDQACAGADAVVIATEWPEFARIDLGLLRRVTRGDLLFDGRRVIASVAARAAGFRYHGPSGSEETIPESLQEIPRESTEEAIGVPAFAAAQGAA